MQRPVEALTKQEVINRLQAHGITPTQQRVTIGQRLFAKPQHLSAEQVLDLVNADDARVSKATVYNTLNLFARQGLVREVIVDPTRVFYDSNVAAHHHIFDVDTGSLSDLSIEALPVHGMPELPEGMAIVGIDVVLRVRKTAG